VTLSDAQHELLHVVGSAIAATMADIPLDQVKLHILDGPEVAFELDGSKARLDWLHGVAAVAPIALEPESTMRKTLVDRNIKNATCLSHNDRAAIQRGNPSNDEMVTTVLAAHLHGVTPKSAAAFMKLAEIDADPIKLSDMLDEKRIRSAIKAAKANQYALDMGKRFERGEAHA